MVSKKKLASNTKKKGRPTQIKETSRLKPKYIKIGVNSDITNSFLVFSRFDSLIRYLTEFFVDSTNYPRCPGQTHEKQLSLVNKTSFFLSFFLFQDSIQPQVPLRLPCYDFTPVEDPTVVWTNKTTKVHCVTSVTQKSWVIIVPMLRAKPIPRVWRAVCTGPGYIFTAACWSAITSDSNFMFPSCREQSELRQSFRIRSALQPCFPLSLPL